MPYCEAVNTQRSGWARQLLGNGRDNVREIIHIQRITELALYAGVGEEVDGRVVPSLVQQPKWRSDTRDLTGAKYSQRRPKLQFWRTE